MPYPPHLALGIAVLLLLLTAYPKAFIKTQFKTKFSVNILIVHNYYTLPGGEDVVFENELALLRELNTVSVFSYIVTNTKPKNYFHALLILMRSIWSPIDFVKILLLCYRKNIDIVHIHNYSYSLSLSIYHACWLLRIPIVQSLHNQRIFCPKGTILRDNKVCTECAGHFFPSPCIQHNCIKDSKVFSFIYSIYVASNKLLGSYSLPSKFVVFTRFYYRKFVEWNIPAHKIFLKPHFIPEHVDPSSSPLTSKPYQYFLFVGRLSEEKGIFRTSRCFFSPS